MESNPTEQYSQNSVSIQENNCIKESDEDSETFDIRGSGQVCYYNHIPYFQNKYIRD